MASPEQIVNWVGHHPPGSIQVIEAHEAIRNATRDMLNTFSTFIPDCLDKDKAMEAARTAMMWANTAVACNHSDNTEASL